MTVTLRVIDLLTHLGQGEWERVWPRLGCPALTAKISLGDVLLADGLPAAFTSLCYLDWSRLETRRALLRLTVVLLRQRCTHARLNKLIDELERWETGSMIELYERTAKLGGLIQKTGDDASVRLTLAVGHAAVLSLDAKVTPSDLLTFMLSYLYDRSMNLADQRAAILEIFPPLLTERWTNPWWEKQVS